ncbi:hypothetical protein FIU87_14070 [Bacillus sp. THAF10]|uniref:hypothetical protein n=1 Tax=Bacillus sp. THAF10 TaxID=2587848 RepID=UPI00126962CC|nr:hypothetical protein [Bacillus sp. THAF10]QFT89785.1 hypothetical protein FIU87_14070 [Bacillus sp. THAF10]
MLKIFYFFILIFPILFLSACSSNTLQETVVKPIIDEFEEAGIKLKEREEYSNLFSISGSDEKQYEVDGGSIYLIYGYSNKEKIMEELTRIFAETEFQYPPESLYTDKFCIIYIRKSDYEVFDQKIDTLFEHNLKGI